MISEILSGCAQHTPIKSAQAGHGKQNSKLPHMPQISVCPHLSQIKVIFRFCFPSIRHLSWRKVHSNWSKLVSKAFLTNSRAFSVSGPSASMITGPEDFKAKDLKNVFHIGFSTISDNKNISINIPGNIC